jgi:hypothetical protein
MTDIVEKLRDPSKGSPRWGDTMDEAADEIERLRAELINMRLERDNARRLVEAARREEREANLRTLARWGAWAGGPDCADRPRDVERVTEAYTEIRTRGDA